MPYWKSGCLAVVWSLNSQTNRDWGDRWRFCFRNWKRKPSPVVAGEGSLVVKQVVWLMQATGLTFELRRSCDDGEGRSRSCPAAEPGDGHARGLGTGDGAAASEIVTLALSLAPSLIVNTWVSENSPLRTQLTIGLVPPAYVPDRVPVGLSVTEPGELTWAVPLFGSTRALNVTESFVVLKGLLILPTSSP